MVDSGCRESNSDPVKMRYFNATGHLIAEPLDDGYVFTVEVDRVYEVDAQSTKHLRAKSGGGYVDTLRVDMTDEEVVLYTYELRVNVDTTQLTDEELVAWFQSNVNQLHKANILLPGDLFPNPGVENFLH